MSQILDPHKCVLLLFLCSNAKMMDVVDPIKIDIFFELLLNFSLFSIINSLIFLINNKCLLEL